MYKVNFFLNALDLGGTTRTAQLFGKYLNKAEYTVTTFSYDDADLTRLNQFKEFGNVILINRKSPELSQLNKCDLIHVFQSGQPEFPRPSIHVSVPHFIVTNVFGFYDNNPKIDKTLFMSKWLMFHCARQIGFKPHSFDFIDNPVENPATYDVLDIAKKWHSEGAIIVGRCGRPDNGIYHAINTNAVRLLRMQGYDVRFIVVAAPPNMVKDLAEFEIPCHLIDPTVDPLILSQFYNSIDIFAHARADGETGGVAIEESTIHGKPTVTHIAEPSFPGMGVFQSHCELVENNITGYVTANNSAEYAEALKKLIENPALRMEMGASAKTKALREYHVDVCIKKLEGIYNAIL